MSRKKIPSKERLIEALRRHDGNMASTAKEFGCSRTLVWQYVDADAELRELTDELSETFCDLAESKLFEKIREGDTACIIFYLKTKARHRGYSERMELIGLTRQDIQIELGNPNEIQQNDHAQTQLGDTTAIALLEQ